MLRKAVAQAFYDSLFEHELAIQPLYIAGCGGYHVNTGPNNGIVDHLEMLLAWPLHSAKVRSTVTNYHFGQYSTTAMASSVVRKTGGERLVSKKRLVSYLPDVDFW